jgi:hypothetical protein
MRPCHSTLENIFDLMNPGSASICSAVAVFTSIILVSLTSAGAPFLSEAGGPGDVGVDAAVLLVVDGVEQALLPEQALEVEIVGLLERGPPMPSTNGRSLDLACIEKPNSRETDHGRGS